MEIANRLFNESIIGWVVLLLISFGSAIALINQIFTLRKNLKETSEEEDSKEKSPKKRGKLIFFLTLLALLVLIFIYALYNLGITDDLVSSNDATNLNDFSDQLVNESESVLHIDSQSTNNASQQENTQKDDVEEIAFGDLEIVAGMLLYTLIPKYEDEIVRISFFPNNSGEIDTLRAFHGMFKEESFQDKPLPLPSNINVLLVNEKGEAVTPELRPASIDNSYHVFFLSNISSGLYTLKISADGYHDYEEKVLLTKENLDSVYSVTKSGEEQPNIWSLYIGLISEESEPTISQDVYISNYSELHLNGDCEVDLFPEFMHCTLTYPEFNFRILEDYTLNYKIVGYEQGCSLMIWSNADVNYRNDFSVTENDSVINVNMIAYSEWRANRIQEFENAS